MKGVRKKPQTVGPCEGEGCGKIVKLVRSRKTGKLLCRQCSRMAICGKCGLWRPKTGTKNGLPHCGRCFYQAF